jgi:hypothetical protein
MLLYTHLEHRFVHYIPEQLEPGVIYISMEYATAAHSCCCGCGEQVITPFTPTDWKLMFDGETVSLWPSIGNWNFPCRSHYIIRNSRVLCAKLWDDKQIQGGRHLDKKRKEKHFEQKNSCEERSTTRPQEPEGEATGLWDQLKKKVRRKRR